MNHWKIVFMGGAAVAAISTLMPSVAFAQQGVNVVNANPNGQATMASSSPVTLPSDQIVSTNLTQIGGAAIGNYVGAVSAAAPSTAVLMGGQMATGELSNGANGDLSPPLMDTSGKVVVLPFANKENMLRFSGSTIVTTAFNLVPAQGASVKTYITDIECGRTDSGLTPITVTFNDTGTTVLTIPPSGGWSKSFQTPIVTAANATLTMTWSSAVSTAFCSVQGFKGS